MEQKLGQKSFLHPGTGRATSANSTSSDKSWKSMFKKSKIEPENSVGDFCKSITIPLDDGRILRVLHSTPSNVNKKNASAPELLPCYDETRIVFFFHGVGGSADLWKNQVVYFNSRGYETLSPDLLGHGRSSKPHSVSSYSFYNLAKDMLQIFDMFKKKRNILVGHSYGASFVTMIAAERSISVSKIILISGGPPTPLKPEKFSVFCLPLPMFASLKPLVVRKYRSMAFHSAVKNNITFTLPAFVLRAVMQGQNWPEGDEEYHSDLLVPVLLIFGRNDKFVSLEEQEWTRSVIYGSTLNIVEEAGHMVMIEMPNVVNQMIMQFLNRDSTTMSLVNLSQSPNALTQHASKEPQMHSENVVQQFINKDLLCEEISGASRPISRAASRLSKHGSEKRTKVVM